MAASCLFALTGCIYPTWTADPDSFADHEVDQTIRRSLKGAGGNCNPSASALKNLMELKFPDGSKAIEATHYLESLGAYCTKKISDTSLKHKALQKAEEDGEQNSFAYYICIYHKRYIGGWNQNPFEIPEIMKIKHNIAINYNFYIYTDKDGHIIPVRGHYVGCNRLSIK